MQDDTFETGFEKAPQMSGEQEVRAAEWDAGMSSGVPEFAGDEFGVAKESNEYYGETVTSEAEAGEEYIDGADSAAKLIAIVNGIAVKDGIGPTVQKLITCDLSGSKDPIGDIYRHFGVDTKQEFKDVKAESNAMATKEEDFNKGPNGASRINDRSSEGIIKALDDLKEIAEEVMGADNRFAELRAGAREAGVGVFDYVATKHGAGDLTSMFKVLAMQREKFDEEEKKKETENGETEIEAETETEVEAETGAEAKVEIEPNMETNAETEEQEAERLERERLESPEENAA